MSAEPGPDERPWRAVLAIPVVLAALFAGTIAAIAARAVHDAVAEDPARTDGLAGVAAHGTPPALLLTSTLVQDLALVAGVLLVVAAAVRGREMAAALGLRRVRVGRAAAYVVGGYLLFLAVAAGWTSALGITDRENVAVDLGTRDSPAALAGALVLVCVVAPIAEELFFRGFLFGGLRRHGLWIATLVSAAAFGVAHGASSPAGFLVPLAALGVILALVYERTGSLYPCIALHALNNSIAFGAADGRGWLVPAALAAAAVVVAATARVGERTLGTVP